MADILTEAKERWQEASDYYQEERTRMLEDLRFSNPANPEQWDAKARAERENAEGGARPCLTLDYTNQFIAQVVNDARQNKPGIQIAPADSKASAQTATVLEGMVRQIEYESRAQIAYDRAIDHAARCGRGWIRLGTKLTNPKLNWQDITIMSVHDPLSIINDVDSTEPDGSDSTWGFVESELSKRAFQRKQGDKTMHSSWGDGVRDSEKFIRLAEYFYLVFKSTKYLAMQLPNGMIEQVLAADRERVQQQIQSATGVMPKVLHDYELEESSCKWAKLSGSEILEERDFPSRYIPLVPVLGHELWVDGKRYISGLTRQLMDAQRLKNYERSTWVEVLQQQPRSPWVIPFESVEGFEDEWKTANRSNKAFLPYNALDDDGQALPAPQRQGPPMPPTAFQSGSQQALDDMQASVGMYRSNFGAPSNSVSGKAKLADQREGDTATFHYTDNQSRSVAHVGRISVDMIQRVKDTRREERMMSANGSTKTVHLNPEASESYQEGPVAPIVNPNVGSFGVRVKTGPAYNTLRQETAQALNDILAKNPQLMPILGPIWAEMQEFPQADKISKLLLALAPKPVQDIYNDETQLPPEAAGIVLQLKTQLEQSGMQIQEMGAAMQEMQQKLIEKETKAAIDMRAAESNEQKNQLDAQVRIGELALKERELGLREREMAIRELEAVAKAQEPMDGGGDEVANALDARRVEIEAYEAETARLKVEQDGLLAKQKNENEAANMALNVLNSEQDRAAQAQSEERQREVDSQRETERSASEGQEKQASAAQAQAILTAVEAMTEAVTALASSKNRIARVTKLGGGAYQMESIEVPVEEGEAAVIEADLSRPAAFSTPQDAAAE